MVITLLRWVALRVPVIAPRLDQVDEAVAHQLRVDAELAVAGEQVQHLVGDRADPRLDRRSVRDPLDDQLGDRAVGVGRRRAAAPRPAGSRPRTSRRRLAMWTWFSPKVRGICGFASRKNGTSPISGATYSACGPSEKYRGGRAARTAASASVRFVVARISAGTSLKLLGTRSHFPAWKASRSCGRQEPGDVPQIRDLAVDVAAVAQRQHLVQAHVAAASRRRPRSRRSPSPARRCRGRRSLGPGRQLVERRLGRAALRVERGADVGRVAHDPARRSTSSSSRTKPSPDQHGERSPPARRRPPVPGR